jgi:DNA-binding PadR family transcriptional regulator
MRIDPSTMVSLVDRLERAGLAKRRPHPQDRRAREVLVTPKGRRTLKRARELGEEVEGDVLRGLSPAERRQLVTLLRKAFARPFSFLVLTIDGEQISAITAFTADSSIFAHFGLPRTLPRA